MERNDIDVRLTDYALEYQGVEEKGEDEEDDRES